MNIPYYSAVNYQMGFMAKPGNKHIKTMADVLKDKAKNYKKPTSNVRKTYVAPKMEKDASISYEKTICHDHCLDRWERTNGNPSRELDDVFMYEPNGRPIKKSDRDW